jgi:nicotinamide riboside kinase
MSKFTDTDKYKDSDKRYDRLLATSPDSDYYDEPQDCLKEEVIKSFLHQELDRARKEEREIVIKEIEIKNSPSYKASVDYDRQLDSQTK